MTQQFGLFWGPGGLSCTMDAVPSTADAFSLFLESRLFLASFMGTFQDVVKEYCHMSHEKKNKTTLLSYTTGCLIGILISWFKLLEYSPHDWEDFIPYILYTLNNQGPFFATPLHRRLCGLGPIFLKSPCSDSQTDRNHWGKWGERWRVLERYYMSNDIIYYIYIYVCVCMYDSPCVLLGAGYKWRMNSSGLICHICFYFYVENHLSTYHILSEIRLMVPIGPTGWYNKHSYFSIPILK